MNAKPSVLSQLDCPATTPTALYTVPARRYVIDSGVLVCNRTAGPLTFRIAVRLAGAVLSDKQYLYYDAAIAANTSVYQEFVFGLEATDVIDVYASATGLSFSFFGKEDAV